MSYIEFGSGYTFKSSSTLHNNVTALSSTKAIIVYADSDDSGHTKAVVATIDGYNIAFGSEFSLSDLGNLTTPSVMKIDSDRAILILGEVTTDNGKAVVLTASGTTLSSGDVDIFHEGLSQRILTNESIEELEPNKFIISYTADTDGDNGSDGVVQVLEISGTTVTHGTAVTYFDDFALDMNVAVIDSTHFLVSLKLTTSGGLGQTIAGTINDTAISIDSISQFDASGVGEGVETVLWNSDGGNPSINKFLTVWSSKVFSNQGAATIGIVTITEGVPSIAYDSDTYYMNDNIDSLNRNAQGLGRIDTDTFLLVYENGSDAGHGTARLIVASVSGGQQVPSYGVAVEFASDGAIWGPGFSTLEPGKHILVYRDDNDGFYGKAVICTTPISGIVISGSRDLVMYPGGHVLFASSWHPSTWSSRYG